MVQTLLKTKKELKYGVKTERWEFFMRCQVGVSLHVRGLWMVRLTKC